MSGHSKWATIKRKKGAADAKRGALFTKLARQITIAAREGGDPEYNFKLRLAVDQAKANAMPRDNIERAVRRGSGADKDTDLEELLYEGYGPHGIALLLQIVTDNRNRTVGDVRRLFTRANGNLSEAGSVAWQFEARGHIVIETQKLAEDKLFEIALEAGADDIQFADGEADIYTNPGDLQLVREALTKQHLHITVFELIMVPKTTLAIEPFDAVQVMHLMENLEELDDVTKVYSNLEVTDEALAAMEE
ncbi:MAG: YebC/PmpR family DNA-binding transcriptional regulator [Anaerolineae bacterium]